MIVLIVSVVFSSFSSPSRPVIFLSLWREVNYSLFLSAFFFLDCGVRSGTTFSPQQYSMSSDPFRVLMQPLFIHPSPKHAGSGNTNAFHSILTSLAAYVFIFPSRPLPEYGDMNSSCGLTDNRSCKHLTIHDVARLQRRHSILSDVTRVPCFASSFLPALSQLPRTRWAWVRLEEAASACPPTRSVAHWSRQKWTCPWTTARALCCRTTFWTRRTTWTSTWTTSTRRMSQIRWNLSRTAMSWSGRVRSKLINQILYGCYSLGPLWPPFACFCKKNSYSCSFLFFAKTGGSLDLCHVLEGTKTKRTWLGSLRSWTRHVALGLEKVAIPLATSLRPDFQKSLSLVFWRDEQQQEKLSHFWRLLRPPLCSVFIQMTHQWRPPKQVLAMVWGRQTTRRLATMDVCGGQFSSENRSIALTCRSSDPTCESSHTEVSRKGQKPD